MGPHDFVAAMDCCDAERTVSASPLSLTLPRHLLVPIARLCSYAKPTDFKRKKLSLLTEKPHYLYISISLTVG